MIFEAGEMNLYYETFGEGEPLLWLHGFMGAGADWRYVFDEPPSGYLLIAPDLRGHGASTNPCGRFSFRQAAVDVLALLSHLKIERIKAIGMSGGGITLLHMATARPDCLSSMVLVSAPHYFPRQAREMQRHASEAMFGDGMELLRRKHTGGTSQIQQLLAQIRSFADTYDDVNFTKPYLSTITADTLVVFGDRDPLYPVSIAFELHEAIPRSHLWVVPNGGHGPVFGEAAPRFRETTLSFLSGSWAGERAIVSESK